MMQDKIRIAWERDNIEVVASATYSDNARTDGWWTCEIEKPIGQEDKRSTQNNVFEVLRDMIDLAFEDLEAQWARQEAEHIPA